MMKAIRFYNYFVLCVFGMAIATIDICIAKPDNDTSLKYTLSEPLQKYVSEFMFTEFINYSSKSYAVDKLPLLQLGTLLISDDYEDELLTNCTLLTTRLEDPFASDISDEFDWKTVVRDADSVAFCEIYHSEYKHVWVYDIDYLMSYYQVNSYDLIASIKPLYCAYGIRYSFTETDSNVFSGYCELFLDDNTDSWMKIGYSGRRKSGQRGYEISLDTFNIIRRTKIKVVSFKEAVTQSYY
jgi:hypothetical protein